MSTKTQKGNRYIQTYRRPGQIVFADSGGVIATVPCADNVPEDVNMKYGQALLKVMEGYGRSIGVYT